MNEIIQSIPIYMSKHISDMIAADPSVINLSIGEPYFLPPNQLYEHLKENLFSKNDFSNISNKYADSKGTKKLREEIANRYERLYFAKIDPANEILVTHGAAEAIWLSILTLTSIGDEIIIADPSYMMYSTAAKVLGRIPIKLPTNSLDNFCLSIDDIERVVSSRTKLLIINSPENPTGAVYDRNLIKGIHSLAKKHNFYFVHDEVYDAFIFEGVHENIFRHQNVIDSNSIFINSFSKKYAMMGWRLGWVIGCKEFINNATKIHTNLTLNLGSFHQDAAATVLNDLEVERNLQQHVMEIKRNVLSLKKQLLNGTDFSFNASTPKGAFFLFPNISKLYSKIPNEYKTTNTKGEAVTQYLLKESKVAVVPGIIYGQHGSDYIRISATVENDKILEAGERLLLAEKTPNVINI